MKRSPARRLLAVAAMPLILAALTEFHMPGQAPGHVLGWPGETGAASGVPTRTAANPAWGNSRQTYRYAFDGKCDDPRYTITTGLAEPGTDEDDCARLGGGLKH